jgi:hypothetical protein
MTEDDEFKLLEQRIKRQKEKEMYPPLKANDPKQPITLADVYNQSHDMEAREERRLSIEHEVKTANAKQVGGTHYKSMGVEPWDVVDTWPVEQRIGAYRAGALKYIMRMGSKDQSEQEIGKGIHYLEKLLEVLKERK